MFAAGKKAKATNIGHQLLQREANIDGKQKKFAGNLFRERFRVARNLYKTDLRGHFGCVNAIEFSHGGTFLASGGDDKRVLVWDVEKSLAGVMTPRALATEQASNIFCLSFDSKNRKLISGGNDTLAISHDFETGKLDNVFKHDGPVYGLSIDPQNDNIFATASENGEILLFDQRSTVPTVVASVPSSFHAVEFHPTMGNLLITANSKRGATLYDLRYPKQPVILYGNLGNPRSCMSVRFNRTGKLVLGLRRRLPPILYDVNSPDPICTFYHSNYYNSCTMKSCTFAGEDDELVLSGSDDFNLYVWRLSNIDLESTEQWVESTQMVLYGHRSIVNQVRYNREKCLLASSGVEKIIKIWSPFAQRNWTGSLTEQASCSENPRELYSPYNLFTMALPDNWHHLSHDYSSENTNEDPRMMAFFDSLIQQEIEEWESNSSTDLSEQEDRSISSFFSCNSSSSSSSSSESSISSIISSRSSSSDSDSSSSNNITLSQRRRRSKRQTIIRRKKQKKQPSKTTKQPKTKLNQLQLNQLKPTNRIAYLIAKKRNTLRRLAIKGASLNNRRSDKTRAVSNGNINKGKFKEKHHQRSIKRRQLRHTSNSLNNEKPTTSAAAAAATVALSESPQSLIGDNVEQKTLKTTSDQNCSSEEDSGNFPVNSSSRFVTKNSRSSNKNNTNVPSTSTGITSNFRDAFLRLSRQIFMSDSDDDDPEIDINKQNNLNSRNERIQERKSNGVHKSSNSKGNSCTSKEQHTTSSRSLRSNQCPRNSAAISVVNNNETILPQSHPTRNESTLNTTNSYEDCNKQSRSRGVYSWENVCKKVSPLLDADIAAELPSSSSSLSKSHKKRRCDDIDKSDDLPTTSSSTIANSLSSHSLFEEALTPSTALRDHQELESPVKRRKKSISDYIKIRSESNSSNYTEYREPYGFELNNNETNNNDIFVDNDENIHNSQQLTPQRPHLINQESNNVENYEYAITTQYKNNNSHLYTPDSGISLYNSTTPSTTDHSDIRASTSATATRLATYLSPCFEPSDCDDKSIETNNVDNDEGVVVTNKRKANFNQFQQKLTRVRRNYRKQFFDDSESD